MCSNTQVHADLELCGFVEKAWEDMRASPDARGAAGEQRGEGAAAAMEVDDAGAAAAASSGGTQAAGDADAAAAQLAGIACELEQCVPYAQPGWGL